MRSLLNWANDRKLAEAVEQQHKRIRDMLYQLFPQSKWQQQSDYGNVIGQLFDILQELEKTISNPEDIRKSATVSQFLRNYKSNPGDSAAHTIDRFKNELSAAIYKANTKNKTPEQLRQMIYQELKTKLPQEREDVINNLLAQVQKGARVDDVVNTYLSNKNLVGQQDEVIYRLGAVEIIKIIAWRDGDLEMHMDKKKGMQACHPLFKGTKWCVRFQDYFAGYTKDGPLYLVRENGKPLILGHKNSEWLDTEDEPPDVNLMRRLSIHILSAPITHVLLLGTLPILQIGVYWIEQQVKIYIYF